MANKQGLAAVILSGISFLLAVVGMTIPFWNYESFGDNWGSGGLWQKCSNVLRSKTCVGLTYNPYGLDLSVPDWIKAVRALEILGVLFIGGAGLCGFLKMFAMETQDVIPKIAAALGITAGAFMLIGAIVYCVEYAMTVPSGIANHLFVGFGLVIVAGVFAIIAGIMFVVAEKIDNLDKCKAKTPVWTDFVEV